MNTVAIVSGGMDSATMLYEVLTKDKPEEVLALSFDYGQRHITEIGYARRVAKDLGVEHRTIDLGDLGSYLTGSSLTDETVAVPDGHYAAETMKATVVPNRNAIMLSAAWGVAVARHAHWIAIGVHAGDHYIYPDCRPVFIHALQTALRAGTEGFRKEDLKFYAPFIDITKADIVKVGYDLGVPFAYTWSCYKGGTFHCGTCGTCVERREAFELAGVDDPTIYEPAPTAV